MAKKLEEECEQSFDECTEVDQVDLSAFSEGKGEGDEEIS